MSIPALINPIVLKWARESIGFDLSLAAKKIKVPPNKLSAAEQGKDKISFAQLKKAANIYKRPISIFYLDSVPIDLQLPDFRKLNNSILESLQPEAIPHLNYEVRKINEFRINLLEFADELNEFSKFNWSFVNSIKLNEDPEILSLKIRKMLNADSVEWNHITIDQAYEKWRELVEVFGVLIFQIPKVPIQLMRGFCLSDVPFPVIGINSKDVSVARSFTLLHEFCHIMLEKSAICNPTEFIEGTGQRSEIEIFCNYVAGAILVPKQYLLDQQIVKSHGSSKIWADEELKNLSKKFKVSRDVVLRRLLICKLTTPDYYKQKHDEWTVTTKKKKKPGGPSQVIVLMSQRSKLYLKLVFKAVEQKKITQWKAADYTGVSLMTLSKLREHFSEGI